MYLIKICILHSYDERDRERISNIFAAIYYTSHTWTSTVLKNAVNWLFYSVEKAIGVLKRKCVL